MHMRPRDVYMYVHVQSGSEDVEGFFVKQICGKINTSRKVYSKIT